MAAFNSFYPTTYQNPYIQPAFSQSALYPQQSQSSLIWVSGDKEASLYPVAPNAAVTLWSQTEPVVYLKQADASGKPTIKIYDLVERAEAASAAFSASGNVNTRFAQKSDIEALNGVVTQMRKELDELREKVSGND